MPRGRPRGSALEKTAAGVGRLLGRVAARVELVTRQRAELSAELDRVIKAAQAMKADLGSAAARAVKTVRRVRRKMSPDARARIAAAARRRWAKYRKEKLGGK